MAVSKNKNFVKNIKKKIGDEARLQINRVAREATKEVMNGLAEEGPVWSGRFRDSWVAEGKGSKTKGGKVGSYPYSLWNVPKLSITLKELNRAKRIEIRNTTTYAAIAMDKEPGIFQIKNKQGSFITNPTPVKNKSGYLQRGTRVSGLRGDIEGGSGNNRSTAPLDWYKNFISGGKYTQALERGIRLARVRPTQKDEGIIK
jgi:hypothetical protein